MPAISLKRTPLVAGTAVALLLSGAAWAQPVTIRLVSKDLLTTNPADVAHIERIEQAMAAQGTEIDIEIVNVPPARVILATWAGGEITNRAELPLPFDPAADFHEYRIDFHPGRVAFLIDGAEVRRWTRALPPHPMRLMVNAWWPRWLTPPPAASGHAEVEWVRY